MSDLHPWPLTGRELWAPQPGKLNFLGIPESLFSPFSVDHPTHSANFQDELMQSWVMFMKGYCPAQTR